MVRNIGIDLDGVIYPWHEMIYNYMQSEGDIPPDLCLNDLFRHPYDYFTEFAWSNYAKIPFIYERTNVNERVLNTLRELDLMFNIHYITSRPADVHLVTKRWLRNNECPRHDYIIFAKDKSLPVRRLNLKYMVEDGVDHIEKLKNITTVIRVMQPHNEAYEHNPTVNYFHEILGVIDG